MMCLKLLTVQMLSDSQRDIGDSLPSTSSVDLHTLVDTLTESQLRTVRWIEGHSTVAQVHAAIVGPAGTIDPVQGTSSD